MTRITIEYKGEQIMIDVDVNQTIEQLQQHPEITKLNKNDICIELNGEYLSRNTQIKQLDTNQLFKIHDLKELFAQNQLDKDEKEFLEIELRDCIVQNQDLKLKNSQLMIKVGDYKPIQDEKTMEFNKLKQIIKSLEKDLMKLRIKQSNQVICSQCYHEITDRFVQLECRHFYHRECINDLNKKCKCGYPIDEQIYKDLQFT
ncbi:hypothetical protein pb186bvf_007524 [Paramecium bursaria]